MQTLLSLDYTANQWLYSTRSYCHLYDSGV